MKESDIKRQIIQYLKLRGVLAWVNTSTGIYDPKRGVFRTMIGTGMRKGVSDILGIYKGKTLAIEVKTKVGVVSIHQKQFIEDIIAHGGIAFVARSVEDVARELA